MAASDIGPTESEAWEDVLRGDMGSTGLPSGRFFQVARGVQVGNLEMSAGWRCGVSTHGFMGIIQQGATLRSDACLGLT